MEPLQVLVWMEVGASVIGLLEKWLAIGQRIKEGVDVTMEELNALKKESEDAVSAWDAAAEHDRPDPK